MFTKILLYIIGALVASFSSYLVYDHFRDNAIKNKLEYANIAIVEYESLLKTKPFEAVNEDRKDNANEKTNAINANTSLITGTQRM